MRYLASAALTCVESVDGLLPQCFLELFQRCFLLSAEENHTVAVADDGVCVVLVDGFQLRLRLQDKACRDLAASDGCHEFFQAGNLSDVGALVDQAAHMHREPASILIVRLFTQQIEQLRIAQGDQEVEAVIRIAHDQEQRSFAISQRIQFQFVVRSDLPKLCNIEHSKARGAGNQDGLCRFAGNKLSRTF